MEFERKKVILGVIGGLSLIGLGSYIYYKFTKKKQSHPTFRRTTTITLNRSNSVQDANIFDIEIVNELLSDTTILAIFKEVARRSTKDTIEFLNRVRQERREYFEDLKRYMMIIKDGISIEENIRTTALEELLAEKKISKSLLDQSCTYYLENQNILVMEATMIFSKISSFNMPKKSFVDHEFLKCITLFKDIISEQLKDINKIIKYKSEFPDPQFFLIVIIWRSFDILYNKTGFEEEDMINFNVSSLSAEDKLKYDKIIKNTGLVMAEIKRKLRVL